jgi:hypothetical protein
MLTKNLASLVCIVTGLQSGRSVVQIPARARYNSSPKWPDRLRDALAYYFSLVKAAEAATGLHLMPRFWISGTIPSFPILCRHGACRKDCACFTFTPTCCICILKFCRASKSGIYKDVISVPLVCPTCLCYICRCAATLRKTTSTVAWRRNGKLWKEILTHLVLLLLYL